MSDLKPRDRDAVITREGLIFRVLGYSHPPNASLCDVEYAPARIFKSNNRRALRNQGKHVFYKFYEDEGWQFIEANFPKYMILHEMLQKRIVGVSHSDVVRRRRPELALRKLVARKPEDELLLATQNALEFVTEQSGLSASSFGIFGSMLHGFHHPKFSDIDFTIHGSDAVARLRRTLQELYQDGSSTIRNEFGDDDALDWKDWRFRNFSAKEFLWHQRRKLVYALFNDEKSGRIIKTEFEPVKNYNEIVDEYDSKTRIVQKGWIGMQAVVTEDHDAPFMPAIYTIEPLKILHGAKCANQAERIVSFMEEFRMQACQDEKVYVEGNLEEARTPQGDFHQVTVTYCPRYYEQVLKVLH